MINTVLVVCTGNICRSPLAEALLRAELPHLNVASAGIGALVGDPADPNAETIAAEQGLVVSAHAARQVDDSLVAGSDLILALDRGHLRWITANFPHARGRVFLLGHWNNEAEVPDPYGSSVENFREGYELIRLYTRSWLPRLGGQVPT